MAPRAVVAVVVILLLLGAAAVGFLAFRPASPPSTTSTTEQPSGVTSTTATSTTRTSSLDTTTTSVVSSVMSSASSTTSTNPEGLKGVTFSPATYDGPGISDFLSKASQAGQILEWAGDWDELAPGGAPATIAGLAAQNGMKLMVVVQFFEQSTGDLLRPLNSTNEQNYLALTEAFVKQYRPAYLGVGIEVNILYQKNSTSFQEFVQLYGQVYDEVKAASPGTAVFTIFQLEMMNGLDGGLYGGVNDPNSTEWQLLSLFKTDVAAFTTYPGLIYQDPSDIPADYYGSLSSHVNESVGFTEIGWHSGNVSGGWESSEQEQATFVSDFFALTQGLDKAFSIWSFLFDQSAAVPFNTMGLFYVNGTAKLALQTWLSEP